MAVSIKNTARGMRGVNTSDRGLVYLQPGETRDDLNIAAEELAAMRNDTPYFEIDGKAPTIDAPASDPDDPTAALDRMSVDELTTLAADENVTLPTEGTGANGRVLKADIVKAITDARDAAAAAGGPGQQGDGLDDMDDDSLRATVRALTGEEPPEGADRTALLALARGEGDE